MSYYILGVVVAFVHTYPRTSQGVIHAMIVSMIWPLTVPAAPFFWLYFWARKPRPERDLVDAARKRELFYSFDSRNHERYIEELKRIT
jgi:hypothetical protein